MRGQRPHRLTLERFVGEQHLGSGGLLAEHEDAVVQSAGDITDVEARRHREHRQFAAVGIQPTRRLRTSDDVTVRASGSTATSTVTAGSWACRSIASPDARPSGIAPIYARNCKPVAFAAISIADSTRAICWAVNGSPGSTGTSQRHVGTVCDDVG